MTTIIRIYNVIVSIWSFAVNSVYWLFHLRDLKDARFSKKLVEFQIKNNGLHDLQRIMKQHQWISDGLLVDWRPWVVTIFNRGYRDDCDGAAYLARWLFGCLGLDAQIVTLVEGWKFWTAHVVCYCPNTRIMVSNGDVVHFTTENWKLNIRMHFRKYGRDYNVIV